MAGAAYNSAPVRVCDRCYNGWGIFYGDVDDFDNNNETKNAGSGKSTETALTRVEKKSSLYSRRSAVVDELASGIPSITS